MRHKQILKCSISHNPGLVLVLNHGASGSHIEYKSNRFLIYETFNYLISRVCCFLLACFIVTQYKNLLVSLLNLVKRIRFHITRRTQILRIYSAQYKILIFILWSYIYLCPDIYIEKEFPSVCVFICPHQKNPNISAISLFSDTICITSCTMPSLEKGAH